MARASEPHDPLLRFLGRDEPSRRTITKGRAEPVEHPLPEQLPLRPSRVLRNLGPGLVTGASDADPGGIGTYSQAGSQFGYGFLWTALFTYPLMLAVQEMCGRVGLQTGVGLGKVLRARFSVWLVAPCIAALVIANVFNAGADLGAVAAGLNLLIGDRVPARILVIVIGTGLLVAQVFLRYSRVASVFKWLTLALFAYLIAIVFARPNASQVLTHTFVPNIEFSRDYIADLVAIFGTTITPYLFFWQASAEVEHEQAEGKTNPALRRAAAGPRRLRWSRLDIVAGTLLAQLVMYGILLTSGAVLHEHGVTNIQSAAEAASSLKPLAGSYASVVFAIGIIGAGLLAVPILVASATYAVKEFAGWGGSLGTRARYRPTFYLVLGACMVIAIVLNFLGLNPIHFLVLSAAVNGVVAPPLLVLITLSASDRKLMRGRPSGPVSKTVCWIAVAVMSAAAAALLITIF